MPRRFDKRGWNRQFKWQPVRRGRWDPFPKDHLPFIDDFSLSMYAHKKSLDGRGQKRKLPLDMDKESKKHNPQTPSQSRKRKRELITPSKSGLATAGGYLGYKAATSPSPWMRGFRQSLERGARSFFRSAGEGMGAAEDMVGMEAGGLLTWATSETTAAASELEPLIAAGTELAEVGFMLML